MRLGVPILLEQWPDKTRPRKPHLSLVNVGWVRMPEYGYVGQFRSFRMRLDYSGFSRCSVLLFGCQYLANRMQ